MAGPEVLASPDPPLHRRRGPVLLAVLLAVLAAAAVGYSRGRAQPRPAPAAAPTRPATAGEIAPLTPPVPLSADISLIEQDPPRHQLRLTFALFNDGSDQVTVARVGADAAPLVLRQVDAHALSDQPSGRSLRLPFVLQPSTAVQLRLTYRVVSCPLSPPAVRVPVRIRSRSTGSVQLDLATLMPSPTWDDGLLSSLCPAR